MNKKVLSVALLATLGMAATSCQKEDCVDTMHEAFISEAGTVYTVQYAVDGVLHSASFQNEEEVDALLMHLMMLAREGYDVMFFDNNYNPNAISQKEVVTYTTSSDAEATKWSKEKMTEGYTVHISYNQSNNTITCTAYK